MIKGIFYNNVNRCDGLADDYSAMMSFLKENGISGIQFDYSDIENLPNGLSAALDEYGISTLCIHIVCHLMSKDDAVFSAALELCGKAIERAEQLHCKRVMIVPAYTDDVNGPDDKERAAVRMAEGLRCLARRAEQSGIEIFIENISSTLLPFSTPEEILRLLNEAHGIHFNFDTANFVCVECDTKEAYNRLRNFTEMVHVKDFGYVEKGGFLCDNGKRLYGVPYGTGLAKLNEVMPMIFAEHPDIPYIIEAHSKVNEQDIKDICNYLNDKERTI